LNRVSVLQISPFFSPNIGGVETHLDDLIKFTKKRNIKNTVITYQPLVGKQSGKSFENSGNMTIYRVSWLRNIFYITAKYPLLHFIYLTPYLTLRTLIFMMRCGENIDLVHAHGINAAVVGLIVKFIFRKPVIVSLHNEYNLLTQSFSTKIIFFVLRNTDNILVLTEKSKSYLINMGINQEKINTYSYWVDQQIFKPMDKDIVRKVLKWDQKFTVLFVGRLIEEKGVKLLLEAAKKMPGVRFVIVGFGPLDNVVKQYSQSFNNIVYVGRISNKHLVPYYCASDILVLPSLVKKTKLEYEEGNPRVIIEALSCGVPVLATDNGGTKELIIKGKVGKIFDSNVDSLIFAIKRMSYSKLFKKCEKRARSYALLRFGEDNGLKMLITYEALKNKMILATKLRSLLKNVGDMALKRRAQSVIAALDIKDGERVLDAGCGDGFYLYLLSNLGVRSRLVGIDFDGRALQSAKRNLRNKKILLAKANLMEKLPLESSSFDKVIMSEVAEHLPSATKGIQEIYRILKPGGTIVLTVPCKNYPFLWDPVNWIFELLFNTHIKNGFWAGIWNQHIRLYSQSQINSVLKSAGFRVKKSQIQTFWCLPFNHYLINLGARMLINGKLPKSLKNSANKFSRSEDKSLNPAKIFLSVANTIDKLNVIFRVKSSGVSIVVNAIK